MPLRPDYAVRTVAYPQIVRWMVDNVLEPRRADRLLPMVLILFSAFFLQSIAGTPPTALAAAVFGKRIRKNAKEFQAS